MSQQIPWTNIYGEVKLTEQAPKNTIWLIAQPRPGETLEEWARPVITNIGTKSED